MHMCIYACVCVCLCTCIHTISWNAGLAVCHLRLFLNSFCFCRSRLATLRWLFIHFGCCCFFWFLLPPSPRNLRSQLSGCNNCCVCALALVSLTEFCVLPLSAAVGHTHTHIFLYICICMRMHARICISSRSITVQSSMQCLLLHPCRWHYLCIMSCNA